MEHEDAEQREAARQALRGFIDHIVIPPADGLLQVVGNLGEMLKAADGRTGSAAVAYVGCGGPQPTVSGVYLDSSVGDAPIDFCVRETSPEGRYLSAT